jgi:long-subunit acyl-CoA synthetase (AMP-forming)
MCDMFGLMYTKCRLQDRLFRDDTIRKVVLGQLHTVGATDKPWEKIAQVILVIEPFSMANQQLTQTLKVRRAEVTRVYQRAIVAMYERVRRRGL